MIPRSVPLFAAVLALLLAPGASHAEEKTVAKVNGKVLTEADMRLAEAEIGNDLGNLPEETKRRVLVEYLIENQLFADAAEGAKLGADASFDKRMEYWRRRALRDTYFDRTVKESISEAAAKTFYDDQVKGIKPEEEVQARHILVETEDKAKELAAKVAAGGDFAALAKENSKDPGTKDEGGLLGFFAKGQMVPQFEEAAFKLAKGEVSGPVQSQFGWHLIKVEERRERQPPTFDQVKERIVNSMIHRTAQTIAAELREKAQVEYVDEGIKKQVEEQKKEAEGQEAVLEEQIKKLEADRKAGGGAATDGTRDSGGAPAAAAKEGGTISGGGGAPAKAPEPEAPKP